MSSFNGVVLGQEKTTEKSNEITAIPELLNSFAIKGCIVTIRCHGLSENTAEHIVKHLLAFKGNQGNFHEEVVLFLMLAKEADFKNIEHDYHEEVAPGHGRVETRP